MTDSKPRACDADVFFAAIDPDGRRRAAVASAMDHLIDCYGLAGRHVVSLGTAEAAEEYHFLRHGGRLTAIDLRQPGSELDRAVEAAAAVAKGRDTPLCWWLGDATAALPDLESQRGDVLYLSGFTPDEERRDAIGRIARLNGRDWLRWLIWPPFHPAVIRASRRLLRPGGLLLVQSFCGGVDHRFHDAYLAACARQLKRHGLTLLDVHSFEHTVGIKMFAAVREARDWPRHELRHFHGRAGTQEAAVRIWGRAIVSGG